MDNLTNTAPAILLNGTQEKILKMLGNNISPSVVAMAVGVDISYVSQLLADEDFAKQVVQLRFDRLQKASELDQRYEDIEATLVEKLEDCLTYMVDPLKILAAIRVINATKRRGAGIPTAQATSEVATIILPTTIIQQFITNGENQVIQVGDKTLATIGSNVLLEHIEKLNPANSEKVIHHGANEKSLPAPPAS